MSESLVTALVSVGGTVCGSLMGVLTAQRLTDWRLRQLEEKVNRLGQLVERVCRLESLLEPRPGKGGAAA
jgi:hypothetical protein